MTECNGCGHCCDPVINPASPSMLIDGTAREIFGDEQVDWMVEHLTPMRRRDGMRMVKNWSSGTSEFVVNGTLVLQLAWYYECDLYDKANKRCTDWGNRPELCRGFPWYDDEPDPQKNLPPVCSFNADIGVEVALEMPTTKRHRQVGWKAR